jgi:hypothetical protein
MTFGILTSFHPILVFLRGAGPPIVLILLAPAKRLLLSCEGSDGRKGIAEPEAGLFLLRFPMATVFWAACKEDIAG